MPPCLLRTAEVVKQTAAAVNPIKLIKVYFFNYNHPEYIISGNREVILKMSRLVGPLVLEGGETVIIRWSDGTETEAKYLETYGYTNLFDANGKEIRLSNHFMRLKGIKISLK